MDASPPVSVPRLRTARLLLREYRMGDFDAFAANLADPEAMTFLGTQDRRHAWRIFGCNAAGWLLQGAGWWSVEERGSGALVGNVGAFFRETWPEIELGWNTFRAHWGKGYATEAAAEVVRHAFEIRKERRVTALVDAGNAPSLSVAARLGLTYESDTDLFGRTVGRYVLAAPAGLAASATRLLDRLLDRAVAVLPPELHAQLVVYGSAPMVFAGLKPDVTFDLDLFASRPAYDALLAAGFAETRDERGLPRILVADAVEVVSEWPGVAYEDVLSHARALPGSRGLRVASLDHVLAFKAASPREKDQREAEILRKARGTGAA